MWWVALLVVLATTLYFYCRRRYSFFKDRDIKYVPPMPFLGSMWKFTFLITHFLDDFRNAYRSFPNEKYFGIFEGFQPVIVIKDPEIIKKVTVKDFEHFMDHRSVIVKEGDESFFSKAILFLKGQKWRDMRGTLSPAFTGSKMRMMLPFMTEISQQVVQYIKAEAKDGKITDPIEMYDLFTRSASDVIATCAFGLKVDSLKDKKNEFYSIGRAASTFSTFKFFAIIFFPTLAKYLGIQIISEKTTSYFRDLIIDTMKYRRDNNVLRPDMIHLLMEAKSGALKHAAEKSEDSCGFATVQESDKNAPILKRHWTDEELAAQAFNFFFAGFEITATALTFLAHELTNNPQVQEKLRAEVDACHAKHPEINYDVIQELKYMDMVLTESLRKYPSAVVLDRLCVKQYTFEPPHPGGKPLTVNPGDYLYIYIDAMHMDEKYYPDPEKFDPERFSDERKQDIKPFTYMPFGSGPRNCIGNTQLVIKQNFTNQNAMKDTFTKRNGTFTNRNGVPVRSGPFRALDERMQDIKPFTYMPFGSGPRNCIGSRFALMEMKVILYELLLNLELVACEKTTNPIRPKKGPKIAIENGSWAKFKLRNVS